MHRSKYESTQELVAMLKWSFLMVKKSDSRPIRNRRKLLYPEHGNFNTYRTAHWCTFLCFSLSLILVASLLNLLCTARYLPPRCISYQGTVPYLNSQFVQTNEYLINFLDSILRFGIRTVTRVPYQSVSINCIEFFKKCFIIIQRFGIRIHDILVRIRMRIRIRGSVPLTSGSGCGSVPKSSVTFFWCNQKNFFSSFFGFDKWNLKVSQIMYDD